MAIKSIGVTITSKSLTKHPTVKHNVRYVSAFKKWLEVRGYRPLTVLQYTMYERVFLRICGEVINQEAVNNFLHRRRNRGSRGFLKQFFVYKKIKDIEIPPLKGSGKQTDPTFYDKATVEKILKVLPLREGLICRIMFETGLRVSEVLGIKVKDFNVDLLSLTGYGKRNKGFTVRLSERTAFILVHYIGKSDMDEPIFKGNGEGKAYSRCRFYCDLQKVKQKFPLAKIHPHAFRHSYATHLINEGVDVRTVQELMRHSTIATTQIYTHISKEKVRKEWERVFSEPIKKQEKEVEPIEHHPTGQEEVSELPQKKEESQL